MTMRGLAAAASLALGLWPALALADDGGDEAPPPVQTLVEPDRADADLRVRQLPVRLKIRPAPVVVA
ncbi:MAG TPA: hypothetical protein VN253_25980, partial [Kofleriaceae bacterium]|nr:hypothetical protein [Kofleriaceae bacterium]